MYGPLKITCPFLVAPCPSQPIPAKRSLEPLLAEVASSPWGFFDHLRLHPPPRSHSSRFWRRICRFSAGVCLYFGSAVPFSQVSGGSSPIGLSYRQEQEKRAIIIVTCDTPCRVAEASWAPGSLPGGHRDRLICQTWRPGSGRLVSLQVVEGKSFATKFIPHAPAGGTPHTPPAQGVSQLRQPSGVPASRGAGGQKIKRRANENLRHSERAPGTAPAADALGGGSAASRHGRRGRLTAGPPHGTAALPPRPRNAPGGAAPSAVARRPANLPAPSRGPRVGASPPLSAAGTTPPSRRPRPGAPAATCGSPAALREAAPGPRTTAPGVPACRPASRPSPSRLRGEKITLKFPAISWSRLTTRGAGGGGAGPVLPCPALLSPPGRLACMVGSPPRPLGEEKRDTPRPGRGGGGGVGGGGGGRRSSRGRDPTP